jgi:hypothetical protein
MVEDGFLYELALSMAKTISDNGLNKESAKRVLEIAESLIAIKYASQTKLS